MAIVTTDSDLPALVAAAAGGDSGAWNTVVERYAGLVVAVCRRWRLSEADVADVSQTVWLRLVEQLGNLREPRALPAWLMTTTRHECHRLQRNSRRELPEPVTTRLETEPDSSARPVDDGLLRQERHAALRAAFAELPPRCRELLALLTSDPPTPYGEISSKLGMPCGAIGPNRARCLDRLRRNPTFLAFVSDGNVELHEGRTP